MIGGDLAARLERWAAEARVDEAARTRSRERWLRRQAEESGTLAGVLADLLEAGRAVVVCWVKRIWSCPHPLCVRRPWTEQHPAIAPRAPNVRVSDG